jgi:hypothetical protein
MDKKYTLEVQQDSNGEYFFEFPAELLNQVGWDIGDELLWEEVDGGWTIRKDEKNE